MRLFFDLTKSGIVVFVLVTGMAGYAMSQPLTADLELGSFFDHNGSALLFVGRQFRHQSGTRDSYRPRDAADPRAAIAIKANF